MSKNAKNKKAQKELPEEISLNAGCFGISIAEMLGKAAPEKSEKRAETKPAAAEKAAKKLPRWSIGRQTAGRGGKVVTLVAFSKNSAADLDALAKKMRKALGCGSHVEENKIVLQGDISERAQLWLEKESKK